MRQDELSFRELMANRPHTPAFVPSAELWPRIVAAHHARRRRRRWQLVGALGFGTVLALLGAWSLLRVGQPIDWQARAQALEVELDTLPVTGRGTVPTAETELARIDAALQAAYDRGAHPEEVGPLWKARSELLDALLAAHRQQVQLTRI